MSEVIVRMEKFPTKCFDCKMWSICEAFNKAMGNDPDWSAVDLFHKTENGFTKPVDCPVIGVLPEQHGDLIDRAWLFKFFDGLNDIIDEDDVKCAPTIVPATERSEDNASD